MTIGSISVVFTMCQLLFLAHNNTVLYYYYPHFFRWRNYEVHNVTQYVYVNLNSSNLTIEFLLWSSHYMPKNYNESFRTVSLMEIKNTHIQSIAIHIFIEYIGIKGYQNKW